MNNKFYKLRENPYYMILRNPKIYLQKIGISTLIVGAVTLLINILHMYTPLHNVKVPNGIHQLIGFLIALLLVFRTNTAYDRWWEGRKLIATINSKISYIITIINACPTQDNSKEKIKVNIRGLLNNTRLYLKDNIKSGNPDFHIEQMRIISDIIILLKKNNKLGYISDYDMSNLHNMLYGILDSITSCERIKNTPIPFAYYIHIKLSIFLYLITLPFSMFYDLNFWSTPIIMILYFLISGVEIISNEIENPFSGEPNDLPIDNLIGNIEEIIK